MSPEQANTFHVRFRGIRKYEGKRGTSYTARWTVGGKEWQKTFPTAKLADSHRATLLTAARVGEPFDLSTGMPASLKRPAGSVTWLEHSIDFLHMKWPEAAPKYRKSLAESLTRVTFALLPNAIDRPSPSDLRQALFSWIFTLPDSPESPPEEMRQAVSWLRAHSRPMNELEDPATTRVVLESISKNLDGRRASEATIARRRSAFHNCLEHAVELNRLSVNPLGRVRRKRLPPSPAIDRRRVANPSQARRLLATVREHDPGLEAFFAILYYAGPRPGEVMNLRKNDCTLPEHGWGRLLLGSSYQRAGTAWTGTDLGDEERQLKHRAIGDTRLVPAHPELVTTLRRHFAENELGADGRLFIAHTERFGAAISNPQSRPPSMNTIYRAWQRARRGALTAEECESPLARRPYDLRHACVSTWLNAGVPAVQVAEWAGHSVAVLLSVYAKCLDGQEDLALARIENAMRADPE